MSRAVIKYLFLKGNTQTQIKDELDVVNRDSALSFTTVKFWAAEFKNGRISLEDGERLGRPKTATADDSIAKIHQVVLYLTLCWRSLGAINQSLGPDYLL
ncbi:HTH_48 domain-containing protein [Nephila pilipes]|uniref:HTH_48 domain-containing protein n=1 Tax=Nephila pilipes TaxID=299642 RepID=A0A8X6TUA9_NEPPI|nr:HTH_48 domain-containing protein [Nephila pilipes]